MKDGINIAVPVYIDIEIGFRFISWRLVALENIYFLSSSTHIQADS